MYRQQQLITALKFEYSRCRNKIYELEQKLVFLPEGYLNFHNNRYYHIIKRTGVQKILAPEDALIEQLKLKRHIRQALPILKKNLKFYEKLIDNFHTYDPVILNASLPKLYQDFDYELLFLQSDICPEKWAETPYHRNPGWPENLVHMSAGGVPQRSKAEAMIATRLEQNNLIYRSECGIWLAEHHYYPDFSILHPIDRRIIYWEHAGKMNDPLYVADTMDKIRVYSEHGIRLGDNLILTWETENSPLTFAHIDDRISKFLS